MSTSEPTEQQPVFEYRVLRLLVGSIAFALPCVVWVISSTPLSSISASYHTEARDIFVGSLFMIATLLVAYQGHKPTENRIANLGAIAAIVAALCPTSCDSCQTDLISGLHLLAGAALFSTIGYFCLGPFRQRAKKKNNEKAEQRVMVYTVCGSVIFACVLVIGIAQVPIATELRKAWLLTFWAELLAMWAFGIAWIVASKVIPPLVNDDERLKLNLLVNSTRQE